MQINNIPAQDAVTLQFETSLATLTTDAEEPIRRLYEDLETQDIVPKHPLVFIYRDIDGDINRRFTLEIAQPVEGDDLSRYAGTHARGSLSPLTYVQRVHEGTLEDMGDRTYGPLFSDIAKAGLAPGRECREVYTEFEGVDAASNVTHVQIEVRA